MFYPINLLSQNVEVFPLFKDQLQGDPYIFDLSSANPNVAAYATNDYPVFQRQIFKTLNDAGHQWGVAPYLEERQTLLSAYAQISEEKRFYHAGLDIIVPAGMKLYSPLAACVYQAGVDAGLGNYGGYVILLHHENGVRFYSFYGHLDSQHLVQTGDQLQAGQHFACIGEKADSGYWFTHTHLQILTERAVQAGRLTQGYITQQTLLEVQQWFPTPYPLFRW